MIPNCCMCLQKGIAVQHFFGIQYFMGLWRDTSNNMRMNGFVQKREMDPQFLAIPIGTIHDKSMEFAECSSHFSWWFPSSFWYMWHGRQEEIWSVKKSRNYFTSCDPHHDIYTFCYWQIFWHSIWHIFWHSIWHIFWHLSTQIFWHSIWQTFWHFIWHIFWHSIWHIF